MSFGQDYSLEHGLDRSESMAPERAAFIRRTYGHLAAAILAFVALETLLLMSPLKAVMFNWLGGSMVPWLVVLGAFMLVGWLAQTWAQSDQPKHIQYLGLGIYVLAEAIIFLPLMVLAQLSEGSTGNNIIGTAGILTLAVFGGLSTVVFVTKKDFSFLGGILSMCSWLALGIIVVAVVFQGFTLGMFFTLAMIALMAGWILYYTSNVLHKYHTDQHVAASLALFASIATLYWYILQLVMSMSRE